MPMLTALLCLLVMPSGQKSSVTARLQVQAGSTAFRGGVISPDRRYYASINSGNMDSAPPSLWEIETGRETLVFEAPPSGLSGASQMGFTTDGKRLTAQTLTGLATWDTDTGKLLNFEATVRESLFASNEVVTASEGKISVFDPKTFQSRAVMAVPTGQFAFLIDLHRALLTDAQGRGSLFIDGKESASLTFKRRPQVVFPCGPTAFFVDQLFFDRGKADRAVSIVDQSSTPPRKIDFTAEDAIAINGGLVIRNEGNWSVRRQSDWTKSMSISLPANSRVLFDADTNAIVACTDEDATWFDTVKFGTIRKMTYPKDIDYLSLSKAELLPGLKRLLLIPDILLVGPGSSFPSPVVLDSTNGSKVSTFDSLASTPAAIGLTSGGRRLVVDYYPDSEGHRLDGSSTWDLETGSMTPPPAPMASIATETYPDSPETEATVLIEDRVIRRNLMTGFEETIYQSDLLKGAALVGAFNDLLIVRTTKEVPVEGGGTTSSNELQLISWQATPVDVTPVPYDYFYAVTKAPGTDKFWLCVDGKVFLFSAIGEESQVFEDMPLPHLDAALKAVEEKGSQFLRGTMDLSATTDSSSMLAVGTVEYFAESANGSVANVDFLVFGSAQIFRTSTKEWKQINVGNLVPTAGALTSNGRTAYVLTRSSQLLKCSADTLEVEDSLALDSPGTEIMLDEVNGFAYVSAGSSVNLVDLKTWKVVANLVTMKDGSWAVVGADGRFDASRLDRTEGLYWVFSDQPNKPVPIEVLMRDYYEPRLLPRIIAREPFPALKPVGEVLRDLPTLKVAEVKPAGEAKVDVRVSIDGTKTAAQDLRLMRDGQLVAQIDGGICPKGERKDIWLKGLNLPRTGAKTTEFAAYAFNSEHAKSETATLEAPLALPAQKGRAFIVTIGVNSYEDKTWDLQFAAADAQLSAEVLEASMNASGQFDKVWAASFVSDGDKKEATKEGIRDALDQLAKEVKPEDTLVIHWAGHGYAAPTGLFYLIPSNIGSSFDVNRPVDLTRAVSSDDLSEWIRPIDAGQIVMIVDACHSAATVQAEGFKPGPMGARGLGQLAYDKGMIVLAATQTADYALESGDIGHGLLTFSMAVAGLIGPEDEDGFVFQTYSKDGKTASFRDLFNFTAIYVPLLHEEIASGKLVMARTSRVTYAKDKRAGAQKPQIFDFSRRDPPQVLGH
jgi:hypothetical protein